eukprot:TCALIF_14053-PA protein Name:"Protein of unknown function" AED:0.18 eAED:0.18 QI:0/0/0/0.5/1/1/2/0/161
MEAVVPADPTAAAIAAAASTAATAAVNALSTGLRLPYRDEMHSLMVEAAGVVNSTPLWEKSYLQLLQERNKWNKRTTLHEGDLALMKQKGACQEQWPCTRIFELLPSSNGLVRSFVVVVARETESGDYSCKLSCYTRPVSSLVFLATTKLENSTGSRPGED